MSLELTYYGTLGVRPDANSDEIRAAYRRLSRRMGPESNSKHPGAQVQFQAISEAYETLNDSFRRRKYDEVQMPQRADATTRLNFTLRAITSKQNMLALPDPQVVYVLTEISADARLREDSQQKESSRLNLTLVLDRSNSMNGTRLEKVKVAAHQIIENLTSSDVLSVVTFNDRADVIIPATPINDKSALKARVSLMTAVGGTEIYQGLMAGVEQNRKHLGPRMVNRVILLTDGHTFGDKDNCLELAKVAQREGIGISAMGLGHDWNDEFLDQLASTTGGTTTYIDTPQSVVNFLNDHVRQLSNAFAERSTISIAPDPDVQLELAFKLSPAPQPLSIEDGVIPLGTLQTNRPITVLFQLQMPPGMSSGFRSIARLLARGDILPNGGQSFQAVTEVGAEVVMEPVPDEPPASIMDALSKLTLYRIQERAREALERGDIGEATRRLENLATRLLDMGEEELANQALAEARRVAHTNNLSDRGRKTLKFHTRMLLGGQGTMLIDALKDK